MKKVFYMDEFGNKTNENMATRAIILDTDTNKEVFIELRSNEK